jgi:putative endonuclease
MRAYYVYIMTGPSRVLYTGVTNDIERRTLEHRMKVLRGFTQKYKLDQLVFYEVYGNIYAAIAREKQIKGWLRVRKIAFIESVNPHWKDLSEEWAQAKRPPIR